MLNQNNANHLTIEELKTARTQLLDQINYCYERKLFALVYAYEAGLVAITSLIQAKGV